MSQSLPHICERCQLNALSPLLSIVSVDAMSARTLGDRVKAARERIGMTQGELERQLGLGSRGFISMLEKGKRGKRPSEELMSGLVRVLGVSREQLTGAAPVGAGVARVVPLRRLVVEEDPFATRAQVIESARARGIEERVLAQLRREQQGDKTDPGLDHWLARLQALLRDEQKIASALADVGADLENEHMKAEPAPKR